MYTALNNEINEIIMGMEPISLSEMDHVKLMRRRDTKYVFSIKKLPALLNDIKDKYRPLLIEGERSHPYSTIYYDTPQFEMYHNHHHQRLNRYKVRTRCYKLSGITFLEIKFKNNKGETLKKRITQNDLNVIQADESKLFLNANSPYSFHQINPALQNQFQRMTLVNKNMPERVTIDRDLTFIDLETKELFKMPGVCIVEVKRDLDAGATDMVYALRKQRIKTMGFSKYCMGTAMTNDNVKTNLFKNRIRHIRKLDKQITHI